MIRPEIVARRIGNESQAIVIVDGFHPNPDQLRAAAASTPFEKARHLYPGIRAPLPTDYFAQVRPVLAKVVREVFGYSKAIHLLDASFSIVTTQPRDLVIEQRLPHVDAIEPGRIALVHYLIPEAEANKAGGTAFFRHRATGFETIDQQRSASYLARLNTEIGEAKEPPQSYIHESTVLFERTVEVQARYNRAVIYRSAMLHSGAIRPDASLDTDPVTGRLTVTAFLDAA